MSRRYHLYGFSSGGSRGPRFLEPVFSDGTQLYVQTSEDGANTVTGFAEFDEDVDVHEHKTDETSKVGEPCTFAVMDSGERLIYGERDYVARYLSQNLRSYLDTPYFLKECLEFTGKSLPEFGFVKSKKDLLELSVAANSILEFARSSSDARDWISNCFVDRSKLGDAESASGPQLERARTIFGAWRSFALENNHSVANSDRWRGIEEDFLLLYDGDSILANRLLGGHFLACRSILEKGRNRTTSEEGTNVDLEKLRNLVLDNWDVPDSPSRSLVSLRFDSMLEKGESTEHIVSWIQSALRNRKTSQTKIAVHVYFVSIVLKTTMEMSGNWIDVLVKNDQ